MPRKWVVKINSISLVEKFLQAKKNERKSLNTISNYKYGLRNFEKWLIKNRNTFLEPDNITEKILSEYHDYLIQKNYSSNTISLYSQSILQFLKWGKKEGLIMTMPAFPKVPQKTEKVYSGALLKDEYLKFCRAINKENFPQHKALLNLYLKAGLTLSEALNLEVGDIELYKNSGWLNIKEGKRKFWGGVPLNYEVAAILREYINEDNINSGYLFKGKNRYKAMTPRNVQLIVTKYLKIADIERKVSPRTLRETFIKILLNQKPPLSLNVLARLIRVNLFKNNINYVEPSKKELLEIINNIKF